MTSPLDERIIASASEALEAGQTHYVDVPGIAPLRAAIAEHLNRTAATHYQPANILITAGMQEARFLSIQKISERSASIAVPQVVHPGVRKALGVRPRKLAWLPADAASGYLPAVESVAQAMANGHRLFYLESPSRLSGAIYSAAEVAAISQLAKENDAAVIWDQGLAEWVADDADCVSLAHHDSDTAQTAAIGEAFPGMGLASWFIGYIAAPTDWLPAMQSQKQTMAICTSTATQFAALEASALYAETHAAQRSRLNDARRTLIEAANAANLDVIPGNTASILALRLPASSAQIRQAGFEFAAGDLFGAPEAIRLTVGSSAAPALQQISSLG